MPPVDLSRRESCAAIGRFFAGLVALSLCPKSTPVASVQPVMYVECVSGAPIPGFTQRYAQKREHSPAEEEAARAT